MRPLKCRNGVDACIKCNSEDVACVNVVSNKLGRRRNKKCKHCGYRFVTMEVVLKESVIGNYKAFKNLKSDINKLVDSALRKIEAFEEETS